MVDEYRKKSRALCEKLIILSQLQVDEKLSVLNEPWKIQPPGFLQKWQRSFTESREDTVKSVEYVISETVSLLDMMKGSIELNMPASPGRNSLNAIEDNTYLQYKNTFDDLRVWFEKGLIGLENLSKTYPKTPNFIAIQSEVKPKVAAYKELSEKLDKHYACLTKQGPLEFYPAPQLVNSTQDEKKDERRINSFSFPSTIFQSAQQGQGLSTSSSQVPPSSNSIATITPKMPTNNR